MMIMQAAMTMMWGLNSGSFSDMPISPPPVLPGCAPALSPTVSTLSNQKQYEHNF